MQIYRGSVRPGVTVITDRPYKYARATRASVRYSFAGKRCNIPRSSGARCSHVRMQAMHAPWQRYGKPWHSVDRREFLMGFFDRSSRLFLSTRTNYFFLFFLFFFFYEISKMHDRSMLEVQRTFFRQLGYFLDDSYSIG